MPVYYRGLPQPPQNPFVRALALIAGAGLFVLMMFLGVMFLAAFLALGVIAWIAFTVRRWWLGQGRSRRGDDRDPDIMDVEYRVVHGRRSDRDNR